MCASGSASTRAARLSDGAARPEIIYTVTYRKGDGHKPEGTLTEGERVKVKDGMIFNVTATDKS